MAIEKGLYSAPMGLDEGAELDDSAVAEGEALEIEIIDPEAVILDDGSVEITLIPDADDSDMLGFDGNLAEGLDEVILEVIGVDGYGLADLA